MERPSFRLVLLLVAGLIAGAQAKVHAASKCATTLTPAKPYPAPSVASGYVARLVATGLTSPRGIKFDSEDHLLVVEQTVGVTALTLNDAGQGCIIEKSRNTVITDNTLNHGIEISADGKTLFASSSANAYMWDYDAKKAMNTSDPKTIVNNMDNSDHATRTLLLSKKVPGMLMVTRGSTSNIDASSEKKSSGHSQIKAFDLNKLNGPYDFDNDGKLMGWGLRNDVGIAEEPLHGGIYSVENSVDQMSRDGVDIHNTNPAEELNFLGYLDGKSSPNEGANFGYPDCYTAWDVSTIPHFNGQPGEQFSIGMFNKNDSLKDDGCASRQAPRLPFHPHMAPLDILFNDEGSAAWITFHGSWDSDVPVGYKVSVVAFANGEPMEPSTSKDAAIDIVQDADVSSCYNSECFRPVGLAWDSKGRLYFSSDETGEIWAILREDGISTNSAKAPKHGLTGSGGGSGSGGGDAANAGSLMGSTSMGVLALITLVSAFLM